MTNADIPSKDASMPQATNPPAELTARVARWALMCGGVALLVMAAVEAWQVFARYVMNDSPGWTEPVALLLLNVAMSLGAAAAVQQNAHFGFVALAQAAPAPLRRWLERTSLLIVAALGAVLAIWGVQLLVDGWGVAQAGTALPQSIGFAPMSLGGALMTWFATTQLTATFRARPAVLLN